MTTIGSIEYEITADNKLAIKSIQDTGAAFESLTKEAEKEGKKLDTTMSGLGRTIAATFSATAVAGFVKQCISVRGEIQALETSFNTLLGDETKAAQLFGEIREYAVSTPMKMKDIAAGAQQLLAFNIEAEKVMPILKSLGDISMGDSQKFQSLTLAFAQMSSTGKLAGQDLLQMINAGFNPLAQISEQTGKSIGELKDEMSSGKISVDMVTQAFMDATSEGGKFYGMLEKQSQGLQGSISNLQGALEDMMNDLGAAMQGAVSKGMNGLTEIVKNYEAIGKVLLTLVAIYGEYKAAAIATSVAHNVAAAAIKGETLAHNLEYFILLLEEKAQKKLNATILANPYAAAGAALAALVTTLVVFKDRTTDAERAQQAFDDTMQASADRVQEFKDKTDELINTLNDENATEYQHKSALDQLRAMYPELLKDVSRYNQYIQQRATILGAMPSEQESHETKALEEQIELYREYNQLHQDALYQEGETYQAHDERIATEYGSLEKLNARLTETSGKIETLYENAKEGGYSGSLQQFVNDNLNALTKAYKQRVADIQQAAWDATPIREKLTLTDDAIATVQQQLDTAKAQLTKEPWNITIQTNAPLLQQQLDRLLAQKAQLEGEAARQTNTTAKTIAEEVRAAEKEVARLRKQNNLDIAAITAAEENLDSAKKKYKTATGKEWGAKTTKKDEEDPYKKNLEKRRQEYENYYKWQNSNDPVISGAASKEYAKLLEGGSTYLEYLTRQRDELQQLADAGTATATQLKNLNTLNTEIAGQTEKTALQQFEESLSRDMEAASNISEMLDIIARKRKEVEQMDDGQLKTEESKLLDQQSVDVEKKAQQQTESLLQQYSSYWQQRLAFERDYATNHALIEKAIAEADEERSKATDPEAIARAQQKLQAAMQAQTRLETQKSRYDNGTESGDTDYDALLREYGTYQQKKLAIEQEYEEKINTAMANQDSQLVEQLRKQRAKTVSDLAVEQIKNSDAFVKIFDNLDELSVEAVDKLLEQIDTTIQMYPEVDAEALKKLAKQLKEAADEVAKKNPFTDLKNALVKFKNESSDTNLQGVLKAGSNLASNFTEITDCMREIAELTGNEEVATTADFMDDVIGTFKAAEEGAEAWGGWWGAIIGGVTDLIPKIIKWTQEFDANARAVADEIERSETKMSKLEEKYTELAEQLEEAIGTQIDDLTKALAKNKREQIALLKARAEYYQQEARNMDNKRKNRLEYQQEVWDLEDDIEKLEEGLADDLQNIIENTLGNQSVNDITTQLAEALVDAWADGEDAVEAYGNKVKEVVKNIARNYVIQELVTDRIKTMLSNYTDQWTEDTTWGQKLADIAAWQQRAVAYGDELAENLENMPDYLKEWLSFNEDSSSLSGAIKGMSQESADILAGQTNAIRINQMTAIDVLRDQLLQLSGINAKAELTNHLLQAMSSNMSRGFADVGGGAAMRAAGYQS